MAKKMSNVIKALSLGSKLQHENICLEAFMLVNEKNDAHEFSIDNFQSIPDR